MSGSAQGSPAGQVDVSATTPVGQASMAILVRVCLQTKRESAEWVAFLAAAPHGLDSLIDSLAFAEFTDWRQEWRNIDGEFFADAPPYLKRVRVADSSVRNKVNARAHSEAIPEYFHSPCKKCVSLVFTLFKT